MESDSSQSSINHWQSGRSLPQCLQYILENEHMCDVTFLVGEEHEEIHAHRFILTNRSSVFQVMLQGMLAERGEIKIPDVDKETFSAFLRYLYTDTADFTPENAVGLLYTAHKYCVDNLAHLAWKYLQAHVTSDNACAVLIASLCFSDSELQEASLKMIIDETEESISDDSFLSLSQDAIKIITEQKEISIPEETLCKRLLEWAEAECQRQCIKLNWLNKRQVLGDVVYDIRFPLMDQDYFSMSFGENDFLISGEKVEVLLHYVSPKKKSRKIFNYETRKTEVYKVNHFTHTTGGYILDGEADAIDFQTSHNSTLHGLLLFGSFYKPTLYTLGLDIINFQGDVLVHISKTFDYDPGTPIHTIELEPPLEIRGRRVYTIKMTLTGDSSRRGEFGTHKVFYDKGKCRSVTFFPSALSKNGTNEKKGQIPGLLLT
ncbi:hypothetical protein FSP39_009763 [Pinctada imbricata]|uniref:BTB domain-containing protein n=1 Tax=Pinctada imbricata TaxID=66713 RepID=A0AA89C8V6_PINIB|nr:hypothetical protein FSP39_009763 [Pinctada imbricata]